MKKANVTLAIETFHLTRPGNQAYFPKVDVIKLCFVVILWFL